MVEQDKITNKGELEVRFCKEADLPAIFQLQERIFESLGDKAALLRRNTEETFRRCLCDPNFTLGVFDGEEMVALTIMEDARGRDDDLGVQLKKHDLHGLPYADYKLVMVREDYRGRGLQKDLLDLTESIAYQKGYRWLCTSVSPDNAYSRANIRAAGFTLDSEKELYGGLRREIYVKELQDGSKRVLIWGHGLEGKSAEAFLQAQGNVRVLDICEGDQIGIEGKSTTASLLYQVQRAAQDRPSEKC